jgi:hypothetical protein
MEVAGLAVDPVSKVPIVVLKERDGERAFPIWIGPAEASAIATRLEGIKLPRPLTHDLLAGTIGELGGQVVEIEVTALKGSTFFAVIRVEHGGGQLELDSRPSDAIALALRTGAQIFAHESVLATAHKVRIRTNTEAEGIQITPEGAADPAQASDEGADNPAGKGKGKRKTPPAGPRILDPNTPADRWTEVLHGLDPEDFGKYKM